MNALLLKLLLLRDDKTAAALVEYALLVGLISVVAIVAVTSVGTNVNDAFSTISAKLAAAV